MNRPRTSITSHPLAGRDRGHQRIRAILLLYKSMAYGVNVVATRPTNSLKNKKFFDVTRKNLERLPHRLKFPQFAWGDIEGARDLRVSSILITRVEQRISGRAWRLDPARIAAR
jgi:hypothetical protein